MASLSGTITLVQEGRFQLASDDNHDQLFVLSHRAAVDGAELKAWERSRRHVTVQYEPADRLLAATARSVTPTERSSAA